MVVSVWVFQFLNFLSSGSFGRYRWSLKQFSRSRHTDEILNADDEDAHPSTDTVDSADEDEFAGSASQQITDDETVQKDTLDGSLIFCLVVLLAGIGGFLSNFLGAGVGTSLMYPIGSNKLRWSVLARPSLTSCRGTTTQFEMYIGFERSSLAGLPSSHRSSPES
jgi:hypothetical protein